MDQFVIRTGSKEKSQQYVSKLFLGGYYYTEKADIYDGMKEVNSALSWAKKDTAKQIKVLKEDIKRLEKEIAKGNVSINKVLLEKDKQYLSDYKSFKFKVIKL